jgi:ribose 5-phosphate isomerase B
MKIAIGSDHHGVPLKARLVSELRQAGHEVTDAGAASGETPVDYPDVARIVAGQVSQGEADRGVLICGSGIGMSIAANKLFGIRAAACYDTNAATMSRRHNDANVLCLSNENVSEDNNSEIVATWMDTGFDGGRHQRRIDKITILESQ